MKLAIVTVGMGFGDEGKGATVDYLCRKYKADLAVRYSGGSQCGHRVVLPDGREHTFSQLSAGSFVTAPNGSPVPTFLDRNVIINPPNFQRELELFKQKATAPQVYVHSSCLVATRYMEILNRVKAAGKGRSNRFDNGYSTCGQGIGETRSYWLRYGMDSVFAQDLRTPATLRAKLQLQQQRFNAEISEMFQGKVYSPGKMTEQLKKYGFEYNFHSLHEVADELLKTSEQMLIVNKPPRAEVAIFEGAQGILLDEWRGFHPYTTWSTVTCQHAAEALQTPNSDWSQPDKVIYLGVTRSYLTRHGEGPFPTGGGPRPTGYDDGNKYNEWQGNILPGVLDLVLLKYARDCAGAKLDGLVLNCMDHHVPVQSVIRSHRQFGIVKDYEMSIWDRQIGNYPAGDNRLESLFTSPFPDLKYQESLTRSLSGSMAHTTERLSEEDLIKLLWDNIAPVTITSYGSTWEDRRDLAHININPPRSERKAIELGVRNSA